MENLGMKVTVNFGVWAIRHRSLCGLWAGPALAAMHLPWGAGFLSGLLTYRRLRDAR